MQNHVIGIEHSDSGTAVKLECTIEMPWHKPVTEVVIMSVQIYRILAKTVAVKRIVTCVKKQRILSIKLQVIGR